MSRNAADPLPPAPKSAVSSGQCDLRKPALFLRSRTHNQYQVDLNAITDAKGRVELL